VAAPTSYADISAHGHREKQAEFSKADEEAHYGRGTWMADGYPPRQASDAEDEEQPPRESVSAEKRSDEEKQQ